VKDRCRPGDSVRTEVVRYLFAVSTNGTDLRL